jgi:hypothetical protein
VLRPIRVGPTEPNDWEIRPGYIPNIQSSWVTQGPKIGQLALFFGANDMAR